MSKFSRLAMRLPLILAGALLGALLALWIASRLQFRFGEESLRQYAQSILRVEESSAADARQIFFAISADGLPFCSDGELTLMRRIVYDNTFVKDIGRVRNGKIYCTSSLGRLPQPVGEVAPDLSFVSPDGQFRTYVASSSTVLFAPGASALIATARGINVVFNPALYARLDSPPMRFSGLVYDHQHQALMFGFGHPLTLSSADVLAQGIVQDRGIVYQPLCSQIYSVCAVAFESRADMMSPHRAELTAFAFGGALLGISVAASALLFRDRQRSFQQRLRRAIRERRFTCLYQPIFHLESGDLVGAEALARWPDETDQLIPPDAFIPVAEEHGFIGEITRLTIDRVTEDLRDLLAEPGFMVTINIAVQDLSDPRFYDHLARRTAHSGAVPGALAFELTERSGLDRDIGREGIAKLKASGHRVFLDDFGTGYSSLAYLQELHVEAIKIDRIFTHAVDTAAPSAWVVSQILHLASLLNLTVVVEGIETREQADYFRRAAPGLLGQGWFLAKPLPPHELIDLFRRTSRVTTAVD